MTDAPPKIRVLVVDDSAFARQVVRRVLERAGDMEIVDIARDGAEALEKISLLHPDVVTLDLVMPGIDGLGVLEALPSEGGPRVIVVSSAGSNTELGVAALAAGAIDLVEKPTTQATDRMYEMAGELIDRVRVAARARPPVKLVAAPQPLAPLIPAAPSPLDLIVVGTSTGGPQALARLLPRFPADFPVPILCVVHMPSGYTEALARRIDAMSAIKVLEGHDGLVLTRGMAVLGPFGAHLGVERWNDDVRVKLDFLHVVGELHRPSVDALFTSAAEVMGARVLGVVMTGMGEDGLRGARALARVGARVIAEDPSSCVVYGMPRAVIEAGLADETVVLESIADAILRRIIAASPS